MKMTKKIMSLAIVFAMVMAMSVSAFAQTVGTAATGTGSITIPNATKGETYSIYKLFNASVTGTDNGSIAYTGDIPENLTAYFKKDSAGNISSVSTELSAEAIAAMKTWAEGQQAPTASVEADGSVLTFAGLSYGYYVVLTTQGTAITVNSTNPNVTVYDKNSTGRTLTKDVDDAKVQIGDTATYTVVFTTSNFVGAGSTATPITEYVLHDTLPSFLKRDTVNVTSIIVDDDADTTTTTDQHDVTAQFDADNKITLDWYNEETSAHRYENGAKVIVTYTATVTADVLTNGTNTATLTWTNEKTGLTDTAVIGTKYFGVKKVDASNNQLEGAEFILKEKVTTPAPAEGGEPTVTYVNVPVVAVMTTGETPVVDYYRVAMAGEQGVNIVVGNKLIKGLDEEAVYVLEETKAPAGYNMLTTYTREVTPDDTTVVEVVNQSGTELPSTGGIGTTIFYALGGLMAVGAGVLLVAKKRMEA